MDAVKLHLAATVLATQVCALYSGATPYFPIEISRTAASSSTASHTLTTGFATLLATMIYTKTLNAVTFTMWLGLMVVALVPDTRNWGVHMAGVLVVFAAAVAHVLWNCRSETHLALATPVLCALAVYSLRLVLKALVMLAADPKVRAASRESTQVCTLLDGRVWAVLFERSLDVMLRGPGAYEAAAAASAWDVIGPVFKVCGVLQWVAFYALSFVL